MSVLPILIAKQKDAKVLKDDFKIGWLIEDEIQYAWMVWGSSSNLDNALKVAREVISEKGNRPVYVSDIPIERQVTLNKPIPELREVKF